MRSGETKIEKEKFSAARKPKKMLMLTVLSVNISNISYITIKNLHYLCIIHDINDCGSINLLENSVLEDLGIYKIIVLSFSLLKKVYLFIYLFIYLFSIYKMIDIMDIYKPLNISIKTVIKNSEMSKFVLDHLKTKTVCAHAVKKLPYLLVYVPDQHKTQQMQSLPGKDSVCTVICTCGKIYA